MAETAQMTRLKTKGYAALGPGAALAPFGFERRGVAPSDVLIEIDYCGVCHSDIHLVRDEWNQSIFPMVPGHEIAGHVKQVGDRVTNFKVGDRAGVGCMVDSDRTCSSCRDGEEQYCENLVQTYNSVGKDGVTPTYGGYSTQIVVDESFVLRLPANLELARVAPLLCAGITTWSPLRHWKTGTGHRVAIVGLGGLGHMAVQFASKLGAEVTVFSTSTSKEADARRLGAQHFVMARDLAVLEPLKRRFDFILSTISAQYGLSNYLELLKRDGTMVQVGVPPEPPALNVASLIMARRSIAGSLIGGIRETQEMLDYCGQNQIASDIELISADRINEAYDRMVRSDVRYRFVIDTKTL